MILDQLNNATNPKGGIRIYFGLYDTTKNSIKKYLIDSSLFDQYANRFSLILALTDEKGIPISNQTLLNLGGLCPPKCPQGIAGDLPDPFWP